MSHSSLKPVVTALGAAFLASAVTPLATAGTSHSPFAADDLASGYDLANYNKHGGEGKCGEGKCGGDKASNEGQCGGDKADKEGKCGEGKCGGDKAAEEGKCGEGKCGGSN